MPSILNFQRRVAISLLAAGLVLAGCSTPPPVVVPPPPPPPIALSSAVVQSAADYEAYMNGVAAVTPDFKSGDDVAKSLKFADGYDPDQLLQGAIAYGAVIALQDQAFVGSLRTFAADPDSRQQMTQKIFADPYYVTAIKGADTAGGLIIATLMDQGQKVYTAGGAVKQSAYDVQHQDWSKGMVVNPDQRLADAKAPADMSLLPVPGELARVQQAVNGAQPIGLPGPAETGPFPAAVVRSLAVAALAALGQAGDDNTALVKPLLAEQGSQTCLSMAKLNLYQCLAVSRPHYEDIFCLGQHAMMDTGQCVMIAAGAASPVYTPPPVSSTEVSYAPKPVHTKRKRNHGG